MQKDRIYVCHTFYHAYVACLKELNLPKDQQGGATLVLSKMSNNFATFPERAKKSGLFAAVIEFDEKDYTYFPELVSLKKDRGNLVLNMLQRMKFCKRLGELEAPFVRRSITMRWRMASTASATGTRQGMTTGGTSPSRQRWRP